MNSKNFWAVIVPVVVVAVAAVLLTMFWPAITGTIKGESYYTGKDVQDSYDKGYKDGNKNETELNAKISYFEGIVDDYTKSITQLNAEIANLNKSNANYQTQIKNLEQTKNTNLETIQNLQTINSQNEETIKNLNTQINSLNSQIESLESSLKNEQNQNQDKANQIVTLKNQVSSLQTLVNQLQNTNELNLNTITQLNNQVKDLNSQITELKYQSQTNNEVVNNLNAKIVNLQETIAYYEQYIAGLESETQVVATFEYDGSVINIQIVNKGSKVSINNPTSTDRVIFNGWKVNDTIVDISTYVLNENTKFVADITYKYNVKFVVDSTTHNTQLVVKDGYATIPANPTKVGYEFDGWTIDGTNIVNVAEQQITADTTFTAVFTKLYAVTFVYENEIKSTINVRNGGYANAPTIESTTYKVFNGWKVNGTSIDLSTYKIIADTTIVADITYKYDVKFKVDNVEYSSQIIATGNYATLPETPTKDDYDFIGWSINGTDIVTIENTIINSNTTFIALFEKSSGGLYDSTGNKTKSWKKLIDEGAVVVDDAGRASAGTNKDLLVGELEFADNILSIGRFDDCTGLTSIKFNNVTTIGWYAFNNCTGLSSILIPDTVKSLSNSFVFCSNLKELSIPSSITYLGSGVVNGCTSLEKLYYNIPSAKDYSSSDNFFGSNVGKNSSGVTIYFGSAVKKIPAHFCYNAYSNGNNITSIIFDDNTICTEIGEMALGSLNIQTLTIPESITKFGYSCFASNRYLKEVYYNAIKASNLKTSINTSPFENIGSSLPSGSGVSFIFGDKVEVIPSYLLKYQKKVTNIYFGKNISSLGWYCGFQLNNSSRNTEITITNSYVYSKVTNVLTDAPGGGLLNSCSIVKVLKTVYDGSNTVLENSSLFTKTTLGDYYIFTAVVS